MLLKRNFLFKFSFLCQSFNKQQHHHYQHFKLNNCFKRLIHNSSISMSAYSFQSEKLAKSFDRAKPAVVLISCGSFSPITYMHLRLFEMARDHMKRKGYQVLGGFASPVSDAYAKKGLAPIQHRLAMVDLALANSSWVSVDRWEGIKSEWTRTRSVLEHFQTQVNQHYAIDNDDKQQQQQSSPVKVMLICGSDLLDSFNTPDLWSKEDMITILKEFGVVVIERDTAATSNVIFSNDLLHSHATYIHSVAQFIINDISSTKVRLFVKRGMSIKYLTPDAVIDYIQKHKLYSE